MKPGRREATGTIAVADLLASIVVFLVALPLCLGIALASGVPPALGLITGIIGGLVVGSLQGSPLQVSGPAAGLTVLVLEIVRARGVASLGAIVLAAGILQLVAGLLRGGRWFRAVPPAVVHGMLAGIGILILGSQFHAMIDDKPRESGLANLLAIPESLAKALSFEADLPHAEAAAVGLLTLAVIVAWSRLAPRRLRLIPPALVAVTVATVVVNILDLAVARVEIPRNILAATLRPHPRDLLDASVWTTALGLAAVASAETLLCIGALDRMRRGPRSDYNRELTVQGVGNAVCGLLGSLPMTAVIVRSSTNVQAGGRTRASAIIHGAWILAFATLGRDALRLVPVSSLAAVLVVTGWKLVNRRAVAELRRYGRPELVTYLITVAAIVATDLLIGVLTGFGVAVAFLLWRLSRLRIDVEHALELGLSRLHLRGSATFLRLPDIADALDDVPPDAEVHVHLHQLDHLDHAAVELLSDWERTHRERGGRVMIDWDDVHRHRRGPRDETVPSGQRAGDPEALPDPK